MAEREGFEPSIRYKRIQPVRFFFQPLTQLDR